jgi:hypothetical protein
MTVNPVGDRADMEDFVRVSRRNRLFVTLLSSAIAAVSVAAPAASAAASHAGTGPPAAGRAHGQRAGVAAVAAAAAAAAASAGATPGGATPGAATHGAATPGGATPGAATPGGATPGATPGGATPGAATAGAASQLPADERRVCAVSARPGQMECQSVFRLAGRRKAGAPAFVSAAGPVPGLSPAGLRAAYGLTRDSVRKGRDETVAIVDAFRDPAAARDLASYRSHFRLGSCKTSSGCLRIVNQTGKPGPLPAAKAGWAVEESLDLDMVSAICPRCHLLLVEARSSSTPSLGTGEQAAVDLGARFVSNSWSGSEFPGQWADNHYFNHPGDAIVFASGDSGYGPVYPADLQYVTAVGGTTLRHTPSGTRPWTETAWGSTNPAVTGGTGSGCSAQTAKPSWQRKPVDIAANGCATRTENDVAAVGNPATGVAVYDTYRTHGTWLELGGTSAATPIIAGVYALAGYPARGSYPASYLYQHPARFHDVKSGVNGVCPVARSYLCHGKNGYDGPTGLGTPNGSYGFSDHGTDPVTLVDPGAKTATAGATFSVQITGLDRRSAAKSLFYTATGLPAGLSVARVGDTTKGMISGTVLATIPSGTIFDVAVTATDAATHASGVTRFTIRVN